jgi:hypothetical protein
MALFVGLATYLVGVLLLANLVDQEDTFVLLCMMVAGTVYAILCTPLFATGTMKARSVSCLQSTPLCWWLLQPLPLSGSAVTNTPMQFFGRYAQLVLRGPVTVHWQHDYTPKTVRRWLRSLFDIVPILAFLTLLDWAFDSVFKMHDGANFADYARQAVILGSMFAVMNLAGAAYQSVAGDGYGLDEE